MKCIMCKYIMENLGHSVELQNVNLPPASSFDAYDARLLRTLQYSYLQFAPEDTTVGNNMLSPKFASLSQTIKSALNPLTGLKQSALRAVGGATCRGDKEYCRPRYEGVGRRGIKRRVSLLVYVDVIS